MDWKRSHNPYFNRWFSAIKYNSLKHRADMTVTILILIDGFLQLGVFNSTEIKNEVTILILIDGFLQSNHAPNNRFWREVTILILIDGFLQYKLSTDEIISSLEVTILILIDGFLQ